MPISRHLLRAVLAGVVLWWSGLVPNGAEAAITPDIERQAATWLEQGRAPQAYALLRQHHDAASGNAQHWFLLGAAAQRTGDIAGAEHAFRRSLALSPSPRTKLELARLLQARGDTGNAERLLLEVRSTNPPAPVLANIDRFLAMMQNRDQTGHAWRARATAGLGHDSNAGSATRARFVTMFGLPFALNPDARRRGDSFAFLKAEFDHIYRLNRDFAWTTSVAANARRHAHENEFDSYAINASTGPVWQPGDRTTVMLPLFVSVNRFETAARAMKDRWRSWDVGIGPQLRYAATDAVNLNLATSLARRTYFKDDAKEGLVGSIAPGLDLRTASFGTFSISTSWGRELARAATESNRSVGATLGWQYAWTGNLVSAASLSQTHTRYDQRDGAYGETRQDRRTQAMLDLIYSWDAIQSDILLSYAYTWNRSTLPIFTYEKHATSLAIRKSF